MKLLYRKNYFKDYRGKYESISDKEFQELARFIPSLRKETRILDLACGSGALGERVQGSNPKAWVSGIDICLPLLKKCTIACCQGDASCLPFKDGIFDIIMAAAAYHHFSEIDAAIFEPLRCLRPGGLFFAYEPNKYHPHRFVFMSNPLRHIFYKTGDHAISPYTFAEKMKQIGFAEIEINYVALGNKQSSWFARCNKNVFEKLAKSKLKHFSSFLAPWFIVTGIKPISY